MNKSGGTEITPLPFSMGKIFISSHSSFDNKLLGTVLGWSWIFPGAPRRTQCVARFDGRSIICLHSLNFNLITYISKFVSFLLNMRSCEVIFLKNDKLLIGRF